MKKVVIRSAIWRDNEPRPYQRGEEVELPDAVAAAYVQGGSAQYWDAAEAEAAENAAAEAERQALIEADAAEKEELGLTP